MTLTHVHHEDERVAALHRLDILDTPKEVEFDDFTRLAGHLCDAPVAFVSLVDSRRQWMKSTIGLDASLCEMHRDVSFCTHTVASHEFLEVSDTRLDPRFANNAVVVGEPYLRFYAGVPLLTPDDQAIGAVCVMDFQPRKLTDGQIDALHAIARLVMSKMQTRLLVKREQEARQTLARQARFQQALLNNAMVAVVSVASNGLVTSVNPAAVQLLGYSAEDVKAPLMISALFTPSELRLRATELSRSQGQLVEAADAMLAQPRADQPETREWLLQRKDGSSVPAMVSIASLSNEQDLLQGFILTALDMTERLRIRKATERLNSELARRVAARTAELARTTSDLQMMSQSLAHDLRQPLISMGGFCGLLKNSATTDQTRHYTDRLAAGIQQINAKADALLYFANLSRSPLVRVGLDLVPIARAIGASLQARAPDRQVTLVLPSALHAEVDAALIQRLLTDLMSNAWSCTAHRSDAVVELGQRTDATSTVFYVKDNGAGFDMTFANSLFEPFQSMRVNDSDPGEGLGLARVKRIVMKHGGRVWAESQPDHGATFCFTLPADPHGENALDAPASANR